jgi:excisionase family DNA binding protein
MTPLTVAQAASILGVSQRRVRVLCEARRLGATKVGRDWMIDPEAVGAFKRLHPGRPPKAS